MGVGARGTRPAASATALVTAETHSHVLDSFALLALFQGESGGLKVRELLERAERGEIVLTMTTVNLGEVVYRTEREYGLERAQEVLGKIVEYNLSLRDVDRDLALTAAHLKARHKMSYADCLVVALAQQLDATVVTGDPDFKQVERLITVEWLPVDEQPQ